MPLGRLIGSGTGSSNDIWNLEIFIAGHTKSSNISTKTTCSMIGVSPDSCTKPSRSTIADLKAHWSIGKKSYRSTAWMAKRHGRWYSCQRLRGPAGAVDVDAFHHQQRQATRRAVLHVAGINIIRRRLRPMRPDPGLIESIRENLPRLTDYYLVTPAGALSLGPPRATIRSSSSTASVAQNRTTRTAMRRCTGSRTLGFGRKPSR